MSKRNKMPGLRLKNGIWHIEKRSQYAPAAGSAKAQEYLAALRQSKN
jgi:hypothetical protein